MKPKSDYRAGELAAAEDLELLAGRYREIRERERQRREPKWRVRDTMFYLSGFGSSGQRFKAAHRAALERGDMTNVKNWDTLTTEVLGVCPELASFGDDPAQALWELAVENYDRLPPAVESWREAVDCFLEGRTVADANDASFEFGANLEF